MALDVSNRSSFHVALDGDGLESHLVRLGILSPTDRDQRIRIQFVNVLPQLLSLTNQPGQRAFIAVADPDRRNLWVVIADVVAMTEQTTPTEVEFIPHLLLLRPELILRSLVTGLRMLRLTNQTPPSCLCGDPSETSLVRYLMTDWHCSDCARAAVETHGEGRSSLVRLVTRTDCFDRRCVTSLIDDRTSPDLIAFALLQLASGLPPTPTRNQFLTTATQHYGRRSVESGQLPIEVYQRWLREFRKLNESLATVAQFHAPSPN